MGFLDKLFGGGDAEDSAPRELNHARDLAIGDIVKFGFAAQDEISNQSLQISAINTYDLGGEDKLKSMFRFEGIPDLRMAIGRDRSGEKLELSKIIYPETVGEIFKIEKFALLFDEDSGVNHKLKRKKNTTLLSQWTAPNYLQEASHQAYFALGDKRGDSSINDASKWESFDYYLLISEDRSYALQAEVYDGGRTDVYLTIYLPLNKIEEMWPG